MRWLSCAIHACRSTVTALGPVQKQVNHFGVMPREIGCFRFRSLDSCRSRPRPTSVESGASSSHHVMGCAPIEATWLLDRPLSRAMTLLLWHLFMDGALKERATIPDGMRALDTPRFAAIASSSLRQ